MADSPGPAESPVQPKTADDVPDLPKPSHGWARFLFILSKVPRMIALFNEFWVILTGTPEENFDAYVDDLAAALAERRKAKTESERKASRRNLSDLIARL